MPKRHSLRSLSLVVLFALAAMIAPLTSAQQTGSISGTVTSADGGGLPGVTVEASSNVLPQPRVTTTGLNGDYRLPALPPGTYTVQFSLSGLATQARTVRVNLGQEAADHAACFLLWIGRAEYAQRRPRMTADQIGAAMDRLNRKELN